MKEVARLPGQDCVAPRGSRKWECVSTCAKQFPLCQKVEYTYT